MRQNETGTRLKGLDAELPQVAQSGAAFAACCSSFVLSLKLATSTCWEGAIRSNTNEYALTESVALHKVFSETTMR